MRRLTLLAILMLSMVAGAASAEPLPPISECPSVQGTDGDMHVLGCIAVSNVDPYMDVEEYVFSDEAPTHPKVSGCVTDGALAAIAWWYDSEDNLACAQTHDWSWLRAVGLCVGAGEATGSHASESTSITTPIKTARTMT